MLVVHAFVRAKRILGSRICSDRIVFGISLALLGVMGFGAGRVLSSSPEFTGAQELGIAFYLWSVVAFASATGFFMRRPWARFVGAGLFLPFLYTHGWGAALWVLPIAWITLQTQD